MEAVEKNETRDKIIEVAFALFCQNGIKSVSMDDIAQRLGMSKKTIYKWFENKNEIVVEAISNYLDSVDRDCKHVVENSSNAIEELFTMMGMIRQIFSKIHPSIFHDLQKYHPEAWANWVKHKEQVIFGDVKRNLLRGMKEELFRKDIDVEVVARIRLAQVEMPFNPVIFPPHEFNLQQVQTASLELYMLGIATLKGHKLINNLKHVTEEE